MTIIFSLIRSLSPFGFDDCGINDSSRLLKSMRGICVIHPESKGPLEGERGMGWGYERKEKVEETERNAMETKERTKGKEGKEGRRMDR